MKSENRRGNQIEPATPPRLLAINSNSFPQFLQFRRRPFVRQTVLVCYIPPALPSSPFCGEIFGVLVTIAFSGVQFIP